MSTSASEWMVASDYYQQLEQQRPKGYAGRDSIQIANTAGFTARAALAVFYMTDGSGRIERRENGLVVPAEWWSTSFTPPRGFQWWDMKKGEALVFIEHEGAEQRIQLYGLSFLRTEVEAFFGFVTSGEDVPRPRSRRGRPPTYDWPEFEAEAVRRLDYHGGFLAIDWRQSDLEREMADWCRDRWSVEPSESTIRDHVVLAAAAFEAEKSGR